MEALPQTKSKHILMYARFLAETGTSVQRLLETAKLPGDCLDDPETVIPSVGSWRFRESAARELGLPNLSLEVTRNLDYEDLGKFGRLVLRAPTLHRALHRFRRLVRFETSTAVFGVVEQESGVWFCHRLRLGGQLDPWHSELYVLTWMLKLVRRALPSWAPTRTIVSSTATPERRAAIQALSSGSAGFGHDCTGFLVPRDLLALPFEGADRRAVSAVPTIDHVHVSGGPAISFPESIGQVLTAYRHDGWLSVEECAAVTEMSVRTLQRRLREEEATYSDVVEETRFGLATEMLERMSAPVGEIAHDLGYSTHANFHRAFRRWAGVTPGEFRRQRQAG